MKTYKNTFSITMQLYNQSGTETVSLGMRVDPWYGTIFLFLEQIAPSWGHISAIIGARVVGSRVDVVTLRDQMLRIVLDYLVDFSQRWQGIRNQGSSMYSYAPS